MTPRTKLVLALDRLRRRPYRVERRGDTHYIVKRDVGDIGHSDSAGAAAAYAVKANRRTR